PNLSTLSLHDALPISVILASSGNVISIANVETVTGGAGIDLVTALTVFASGDAIDLAGGTDTLILANGANGGTFANIETIVLSGDRKSTRLNSSHRTI